MSVKKGFTLIEVVVALVIIAISIVIVINGYNTMVIQAGSVAAEHNLIAMYNAQKNYYFGAGGYYNSPSSNDLPGINAALKLNITDNNFTYYCSSSDPSSFFCEASYNADPNLIIMAALEPYGIILPGGPGCPVGQYSGLCNPNCHYPAHQDYCPQN